MARSAEASATRTSTCRSPSAARSSRSVARNQRAATAGARVAAAAPASSRSWIASSFPCSADCSTWCARSPGPAPLAASSAAARACAASLQPPGRGLVDRRADERVAKDEPPRDRRRAQEITREQGIERSEPVRGRKLRNRRCQIGLERLAGHRRGLEQPRARSPRAPSAPRPETRRLLGERRPRRPQRRSPAPRASRCRPPRASCSR